MKMLFIVLISTLFIGCSQESYEEQKSLCLNSGGILKKYKKFNFREGVEEIYYKCDKD